MLILLASYAVWVPAIIGFGFLATRLRDVLRADDKPDPSGLLVTFVIGALVLGSISNIINLFFPISPLVSALLFSLT